MVISEREKAKEEVRREVNAMRSELNQLISPIRDTQGSRRQGSARVRGRSLLHDLAIAARTRNVSQPSSSQNPQPSGNGLANGTASQNNGSLHEQRARTLSTSGTVNVPPTNQYGQSMSGRVFPIPFTRAAALLPFPLSETARLIFRRDRARSKPRVRGGRSSLPSSSSAAEDFARDPDIAAFQYNPETFRYSELYLRQACSVMATFDIDRHFRKIVSTLCKYSIRIYGLEDCEPRDLTLAVFFFIERYFNFRPVIELCIRGISDTFDTQVTGVVFDRTTSTQNIMENLSFLIGTPYRIERNFDTAWIIENLDY